MKVNGKKNIKTQHAKIEAYIVCNWMLLGTGKRTLKQRSYAQYMYKKRNLILSSPIQCRLIQWDSIFFWWISSTSFGAFHFNKFSPFLFNIRWLYTNPWLYFLLFINFKCGFVRFTQNNSRIFFALEIHEINPRFHVEFIISVECSFPKYKNCNF